MRHFVDVPGMTSRCACCDVMQLQVITDEHLHHLVAMATDEPAPDSAAQVDEMLDALNHFYNISAVSCFCL